MKKLPKIYADFQKLDNDGNLVLSCRGTLSDLRSQGIDLVHGLEVVFYSDDEDDEGMPTKIMIEGKIAYNSISETWVGVMGPSGFFYEAPAE